MACSLEAGRKSGSVHHPGFVPDRLESRFGIYKYLTNAAGFSYKIEGFYMRHAALATSQTGKFN